MEDQLKRIITKQGPALRPIPEQQLIRSKKSTVRDGSTFLIFLQTEILIFEADYQLDWLLNDLLNTAIYPEVYCHQMATLNDLLKQKTLESHNKKAYSLPQR